MCLFSLQSLHGESVLLLILWQNCITL